MTSAPPLARAGQLVGPLVPAQRSKQPSHNYALFIFVALPASSSSFVRVASPCAKCKPTIFQPPKYQPIFRVGSSSPSCACSLTILGRRLKDVLLQHGKQRPRRQPRTPLVRVHAHVVCSYNAISPIQKIRNLDRPFGFVAFVRFLLAA